MRVNAMVVGPMRDMAALIKHVGRGARLAKDLSLEEAAWAMRAIVSGEANAYQTGAFLLAMRMKGESAVELAGFTTALREVATLPIRNGFEGLLDVDYHADGREGRPAVVIPAACVAAALGTRPLIRGAFGGPFAKTDLDELLVRLALDPRRGLGAARRSLHEAGFAVVDLSSYAPRVAELLELRAKLGVRTCVNSAVKLLDPAGTRRQLVGIFHGPYHEPVAGAARILGAERAAVVQAPGGVPEPQPDRPTKITLVDARLPSPSSPLAIDGAKAPLARPAPAPVPEVHGAAEMARQIEETLRKPDVADPAIVRMTLLCAGLMMWVSGKAESPTDAKALAAASDVLFSGRAAHALDVARVCYSSEA
jgi:anthranilate phosphoribosyltransferase